MVIQQSTVQYSGSDYTKSIHPDRWGGIVRTYTPADVESLRTPIHNDPTLARKGAERFWELLKQQGGVRTFGVDNPVEAVNAIRGGHNALYVSGWMVAANANSDGVLPDMGLYSMRDGPDLVRRLNLGFARAYQVDKDTGKNSTNWNVPIIADIESGFGGINNVYMVTSGMIMAGAAAVHIEDQDPSQRKCGHMAGKVVIPIESFIEKLAATRLTADIYGVPAFIIARTDALNAQYMAGFTEDMGAIDGRYIRGRGEKGLYPFGDPNGSGDNLEAAIARGLAYAPYADMLWMETGKPDIGVAKEFAQAIHKQFPKKGLAYNLSPSFYWRGNLEDEQIRGFMDALSELGYNFQFSTLLTWRQKGVTAFKTVEKMHDPGIGMLALAEIQDDEREAEERGYVGVKHQGAVGIGFFDKFGGVVTNNNLRTAGGGERSTEHQFGGNG